MGRMGLEPDANMVASYVNDVAHRRLGLFSRHHQPPAPLVSPGDRVCSIGVVADAMANRGGGNPNCGRGQPAGGSGNRRGEAGFTGGRGNNFFEGGPSGTAGDGRDAGEGAGQQGNHFDGVFRVGGNRPPFPARGGYRQNYGYNRGDNFRGNARRNFGGQGNYNNRRFNSNSNFLDRSDNNRNFGDGRSHGSSSNASFEDGLTAIETQLVKEAVATIAKQLAESRGFGITAPPTQSAPSDVGLTPQPRQTVVPAVTPVPAPRQVEVIPEMFGNHFVRKIPGTIELEGPNGEVYDVGVTKHKNRAILHSGWEVFVDANNIVEKDSLMFRYRGRSRFKVAVFDSGGCEKRVSCAGIESDTSDQERSKNSADMSSSSSDHNTRSSVGRGSDGCQSRSSGHCRKWARTDATSSSSGGFSGEDSPSESDGHTLSKPLYVLSGQCYVTEEQEANIVALVEETQPKMPLLVAMMKKPNVKPYPDLNGSEMRNPPDERCKSRKFVRQMKSASKVKKEITSYAGSSSSSGDDSPLEADSFESGHPKDLDMRYHLGVAYLEYNMRK
ncbi:hypothetical protein ACQ4PT_031264 [Festuca glaucescens]